MKNISLRLPEDLLNKSREYAQKQGTTLNQFIRDLLVKNVKNKDQSTVDALLEHARKTAVNSGGYKWNREDAYEG